MLQDDVLEIINKDFEEVQASSLSLKLLKVYSILYLYGTKPSWCSKCLKDYYFKLKKDGMEKAKKIDENQVVIKKGVLKKGLTYYPCLGKHVSEQFLTDSDARHLLKNGWLKEEDFEVLPKGYKSKKVAKEVMKDVKKKTVKK